MVNKTEFGLRNDVYRRPLATALNRLSIAEGWKCADIGAGGGDVSVALAEVVGAKGRVYAIDNNPLARNEVAETAAEYSQVIAITQKAESLRLPELVDLAFCRFLLMHVKDPFLVITKMASAVKKNGWIVAQEPITSSGRIGNKPFSMLDCSNPDIGALLPGIAKQANLEIIDAWAEAPAGVGPGPISDYLKSLTGISPGNDSVILPPLVTVIARTIR